MTCDLVIPALDERANVDDLFAALAPYRGVVIRRIVLADNGSTDGTAEAAGAHGAIVVREPRRGYGGACLKAIEWIADAPDPPDVLAFLDADLSDDPSAVPDVVEPIRRGEAEFVIGSRVRLADRGALTHVQRGGNRLACALMAVLAGGRYTDLGPLRAIRWPVLEGLAMADRTWGWTVEMQMKAAIVGIRTVEVDVPYRARSAGRSTISGTYRGAFGAGWKIIATILMLWWRRNRIAARYQTAAP